jgi:hypothetical protein
MYASIYINHGERTWVESINIDDKEWIIKYIYSVYWAITTIVTVGYGDLTPQNYC